jgi:nitrogen fixation/metabolism regulation signal transduction histidine kinase
MARQVAHEIKNPLTPIQLSAEHLRRVNADSGRPLGPVLENCVDSILRQVRLLRQIATEFSSFASSPAVRPSEVAVADLLHEVVDPYRSGLGDRIALALEIEPGLPPLYVDRVLVARALTNVLENAVHAITGPGAVRLHAGLEPAGGYLHVTVADTGAGMDEQSLQRIFEPYFSTKASGTGLGLPIAQRNVELNGGTVEVESAPGAGTKVIIRLPIATGETAGPM